MSVTIHALNNGAFHQVRAACRKGNSTVKITGGLPQGVPVICKTSATERCLVCVDYVGNKLMDSCRRSTQVSPRFRAFNASAENISFAEKTGAGSAVQDVASEQANKKVVFQAARLQLADEFNQVLVQEYIGTPYLTNLNSRISAFATTWSQDVNICESFNQEEKIPCTVKPSAGQCYCNDKSCEGAKLALEALRNACNKMPPNLSPTEKEAYISGLVTEHGIAVRSLLKVTYANKGVYDEKMGLEQYQGNVPPNTEMVVVPPSPEAGAMPQPEAPGTGTNPGEEYSSGGGGTLPEIPGTGTSPQPGIPGTGTSPQPDIPGTGTSPQPDIPGTGTNPQPDIPGTNPQPGISGTNPQPGVPETGTTPTPPRGGGRTTPVGPLDWLEDHGLGNNPGGGGATTPPDAPGTAPKPGTLTPDQTYIPRHGLTPAGGFPPGTVVRNMPGGLGPGGVGRYYHVKGRTPNGNYIVVTHSPLVLDLKGDGIQPTSVKNGVNFDLMGLGPLMTAWIKDDDALLALDRNGNGRIDNGSELFGSSTLVDGLPATNGFKALAKLDQPVQGGNGNGHLDAGDKMFGALRAWKDANGDGVSSQDELHPLKEVGVKSLSLEYQVSAETDTFGNDLSLQGRFQRTDGHWAKMIDVFFVVTGK
jgi:hypothetical protein